MAVQQTTPDSVQCSVERTQSGLLLENTTSWLKACLWNEKSFMDLQGLCLLWQVQSITAFGFFWQGITAFGFFWQGTYVSA